MGFRSRLTALQTTAYTVALLSQLQGQVSGPLLLTTLAPTSKAQDSGSVDQPNPQGYVFPVSLRGDVAGPPYVLLTTAPLPDGQHAADHQPNPLSAVWSRSLFESTPSLLTTVLATAPETPKVGPDQPNPRGPAWSPALFDAAPSLLTTTLAPLETLYVPRAPLITRYPPQGVPQSFVSQNLLQTTIQPAPETPPAGRHAGDHQPNPLGPRHSHQGFLGVSPLILLTTAPPETFNTRQPLITKWERKPHPVDVRTWKHSHVGTPLEGQDDVPLTCLWGNPPDLPYPLALRTWTQNLLESTLGAAPEAFPAGRSAGLDQPNPQIIPIAQRLQSWTLSLQQSTLAPGVDPLPVGHHAGFDQPNPRILPFAQRIHTWDQSPFPPPAAAPPVRPFDWPNPLRRLHPISLLTITSTPVTDSLTPVGEVLNEGDLFVVTMQTDNLSVVTIHTGDLPVVAVQTDNLKV